MNLRDLHRTSDGISPYLQCPWCEYADVIGEFLEYRHPHEPMDHGTGSTECSQCGAAGPTACFALAYDETADLGDDNRYRDVYLTMNRVR